MKSTKKILSIVLSILMVMTSITCAFTVFGATGDVSEDQWQALITAIKNDTVQKATFTSANNTCTVIDEDGSIIKLADAYWAVLGACYDKTNPGSNTTVRNSQFRTLTQVANQIKTTLSQKMGEEFDSYKVGSIISSLSAEAAIDASSNSHDSDSNTGKYGNVTVTLIVKPSDNYKLPGSKIEDIPESMDTGKTYTVTHSNGQETSTRTEGSGCNAKDVTTYYNFLHITGLNATVTDTIKRADYEKYEETFKKYEYLFNEDVAALFKRDASDLQTAAAELNAAVEAIPESILNQFFADYAAQVSALVKRIDTAIDAQDANSTIIPAINAAVEAAASTEDRSGLVALQSTINSNLALYNAKSAEVKAFLEENGYIDLDKVNAALADIMYKIAVYDLKTLKEQIEASMNSTEKYAGYDLEAAAEGAYDAESGDIAILRNTLASQLSSLKTLVASSEKAAIEVLGEDYADYVANVQARADSMNALASITGYSADLQAFLDALNAKYVVDADKSEIQNTMAKYDFYVDATNQLDDYTANIPEGVDPDLAQTAIDIAKAEIAKVVDETKNILVSTITAQLNEAEKLLETVTNVYGSTVTIDSIETYRELKKAIGAVDVELYEFTRDRQLIDQELIDLYLELNKDGLFDRYNAFLSTAGFDSYQEKNIEIVRHPGESEKVRDKDYEVTDENATAIVALLDKVLKSEEIEKLLGLNIGEELEGLLTGLLDKLYTDEFINTVMQFLYPLVAKEFAKVWAGLPETVQADNPIGSGKLDVALSLYDIETAMQSIHFPIFPTLLADSVRAQYPQVAEVLAKSTTKAVYHPDTDVMDNPWEDAAICNEDGKLNLNWGVNEAAPEDKEEAFLNAAQAALTGLEPILLALLCNKTLDGTHTDNDNNKANDGQPGHGKVGTGTTRVTVLFLTVNVTVDPINLFLNVSGNEGYNNVIVPILEALGLDSALIPDGNTFNNTKDVLKKGLLEPVKAFLKQLAANPIETLAAALPNIAYALEADMIVPLLGMLKTDITYHADAHYSAVAGLAAGDINEALKDGPITINVGEMLDLSSIKINDAPLNLSSLNGLFSLLDGLLGFDLPDIDGATLATLGKLTWKDTKRGDTSYTISDPANEGKAAYIEANKGDVLIFVLQYILKAAADPEFIPAIVKLIGGNDGDASEEKVVELPAIVEEILANIMVNPDNAIAAITELIFPQEYSPANGDINWVTPDSTAYPEVSYPTEAWTREKAQFVVDNFGPTVDNILMIAGVKLGVEYDEATGDVIKDGVEIKNLPDLLNGLLDTLYTADTVNKLADLIAGLIEGLQTNDDGTEKTLSLLGNELKISDLLAMVKEIVGVDLSYWSTYEATYEGSDREQFKKALVDVLSPLTPVLKFIITGENLTAKLTDKDGKFKLIELQGYDSYTNGIIPLVEALGATDVMAPAEFFADSDNIAENIIDELLSAIDNLTSDPYNKLLDLLLNVVYFIASDGVPVVINNVLHGVNAVLEIISPIYKVDLSELLGLDITFAKQDILSFLLNLANTKIKEATGLEIFTNFTASSVLDNLSFGEVTPYDSANGKTAYKVTKVSEGAADLLTVIGRFIFRQLVFSTNAGVYAELAGKAFNLDEDSLVYRLLYTSLVSLSMIEDGPDYILGVIFWIFFGADTAVDAVADYYKYYSYDWAAIIAKMNASDVPFLNKASYLFKEVYEKTFETILDDLDVPVNSDDIRGFAKLFKTIMDQIKAFFESIGNFFKNMFN